MVVEEKKGKLAETDAEVKRLKSKLVKQKRANRRNK